MSERVFLLVAEDRAHHDLAVYLGDRVAVERHPWLADYQHPQTRLLDEQYQHRAWQGFAEASRAWVKWTELREHCQQSKVPRVHGVNYGLQRRQAEMALRLMMKRQVIPAAVVLLCDADRNDHQAVRESLHLAREGEWPFTVIIGVCAPEAESWFLCGFVPGTVEEEERLRTVRRELGFDPCESADRLSSGRNEHKRNAKRVLGELVASDPETAAQEERSVACIRDSELALLRRRGQRTGLTAFLDELEERLAGCYD